MRKAPTASQQIDAIDNLGNALHDCKSITGVLLNLYDNPEARDFEIPAEHVRGTIGILMDRIIVAVEAADLLNRAREHGQPARR